MMPTKASSTITSGSSSRSGGSLKKTNNSVSNRRSPTVWECKIVFVILMVSFGCLLGYGSYSVLRKTESDASEAEFTSIAERALVQALQSAQRDQAATATMASTVAKLLPNADAWPFVYIPDFNAVSRNVLRLASPGSHLVFFPIVQPEEQALSFEEFAYDYYFNIRDPPHPNGTGNAGAYGFGIWEEHVPEDTHGDYDVSVDQTRVHAITGETNWGSPYQYLTPIFQWTSATFGLMFDTHSTETQGGLQTDSIINCTQKHFATQNLTTASYSTITQDPEGILKCSALTEVFALWANQRGPESAIFSPIFPAHNKTTLTGFIGMLIIWKDVLENLFSESVSGIDCVLQTSTQAFTYKVVDGQVHYSGVGDLHKDEPRYNRYRQSVDFVENGLFTENSPRYSLTLYPNDDFYDIYSTRNPWIAAVGSASIFLLTCLLFFLYDFLVGKEVRAKQDLLKAKRNFMRFVSHEVRTPLNSVCMGLELMQKEIAECFGYSSVDSMKLSVDETRQSEHPSALQKSEIVPLTSKDKEIDVDVEASKTTKQKQQSILFPSRKDAIEWFELTTEIMEHAQSAVSVLSDILNYDKVEAGKLTLELAPMLLFSLFMTTVDEFRIGAENKGLKYESLMVAKYDKYSPPQTFRTLQDLPHNVRNRCIIVGDWVRLQQVLRNFLSNAIKFSHESSGSVVVEAIWESDDSHIINGLHVHNSDGNDHQHAAATTTTKKATTKDYVLQNGKVLQLLPSGRIVVKIKDTGAGMTPEQLSKLFAAGLQFNANELQAGQGSGLGLYITKGIVEQHGGTVVAESNGLGKGSTFSLTLPAYVALNDDEEEGLVSSAAFDSSHNNNNNNNNDDVAGVHETSTVEADNAATPRTVLVVDDVFSNRRLLARLLEKHGDVCEMAVDGLDCLDKVTAAKKEGRQFDIILLDYEMPNMNGPDCAKVLRASGCSSLIIGVTGNCLSEDVDHFKEHGADDVLPKPFKLESLQDIWARQGIRGAA